MKYNVNDIYNCIQGEGVLTGVPMTMLRLQGCGVGCSFCDTKETWSLSENNKRLSFLDVKGVNPLYWEASQSEIVSELPKGINWVLLSGGEPANYDLKPLVNALHDNGRKVAIETSGTADGFCDAGFDWVCISPKINQRGGLSIIYDIFNQTDEIKFVVGRSSDVDVLDDLLSKVTLKEGCQICLQPISQSRRATELCIKVATERNYRLSVQVHKYLGIN